MKIEIISDTICPWCFIGKRRLEHALAQRPAVAVEIDWQPFFLNPDMPAEGMDRGEYLAWKFGGEKRARAIYQRVESAGAGEDIGFRFDLIKRTPNTTDSHRLIHYASRQNKQDVIVETLFRAYFLEGKNIGDTEVLAGAAAVAGLERDAAQAYLQSGAGDGLIMAAYQRAIGLGVGGVPFFIVDGRYAVSGAQPAEAFLQIIDQLAEEQVVK